MTDSKEQALKEKEAGNAAYKGKDFAKALAHYEKAIELDPNNIIFYNNVAAVHFEQGDYDKCIESGTKGVEVGRDSHADFKLIAKALARMGNAYHKKGDLENALLYLNKSLSEHRAPDVVKKANELQKEIKEKERLAYINPEIALEEKQKGNQAFQKGDYPGALKHYSESLKRNPDDAKVFSNRAACYTKLLEFSLALKDCEEAIRLDPGFVKAYLRKGTCLFATKDTYNARKAYEKALEIDPDCQEAKDGMYKCMGSSSGSKQEGALNDPEVQEILGDPTMRMILQQMQSDPKALAEHLKNPDIANKLEKLLTAGVIQFK